MGSKMQEDARGQSSIDFIFGFAVFLLTFIFAISFIAGLFTPFQPGAIDLSSVAYRTTALLVEDPGWYIGASGTPSGTGLWETYNLTQLKTTGSGLRIGLANNKSTPNMLSIDKINAFKALASDNYSIARDRMGLNGSIEYNFNISLIANTTIPSNPSNVKNITLLNVVSPYGSNNNVELLDRKVMVSMGKELFINSSIAHADSYQWINLSNLTAADHKDIIIRIHDAMGKVDKVGWSTAAGVAGPDTWSYGDDYLVYLNGDPVYNFESAGATLNSGDILDVVVYNGAFRDPMGVNLDPNKKFVYLRADSAMFPGNNLYGIDYYNDPTYRLTDVYYPATLRLEIWSYEFA